MESILTQLAIFVLSYLDGAPLRGVPFYAEVLAPPARTPTRGASDRFNGAVGAQMDAQDNPQFSTAADRETVVGVIVQAVYALLTPASLDRLQGDPNLSPRFFAAVVASCEAGYQAPASGVDAAALQPVAEATVRAAAASLGLDLLPDAGPSAWIAYPLGVIASDHAGYMSFDLTTLPQDVRQALGAAVAQRRAGTLSPAAATVTLYAVGRAELQFDALVQGRFTDTAIVARIALDPDIAIPSTAQASGFRSMQRPTLADWTLSPSSFAANPIALLGDDGGCENILPSNLATRQFRFYQVVGLSDADGLAPPELAGQVRLGVTHDYIVEWIPLGHSLGDILYSMPLAPGESVNLAVIDWTRRDDAQRKELTTVDEQLVHQEHRDRVISETVDAAVKEYQSGGSFMAGLGASQGSKQTSDNGDVTLTGLAGSLGGASTNSSGSRDLAASTVQNISDNISQASSSARELQSTVVVHSNQSEHEAIETRTVVNYNHSHALTILYYEVLRHFRVSTRFLRRSPAVLVKYRTDWFDGPDAQHNIIQNRSAIEAALLAPQYAADLDAVERVAERNATAGVPALFPGATPPPAASARRFRYFIFDMMTGGMFSKIDDGAQHVEIVVDIVSGPGTGVRLNDAQGGIVINPPGSFRQANANNRFTGIVPPLGEFINWSDISAAYITITPVGGSDSTVSFQSIKMTGVDEFGMRQELVNETYETGHLIIFGLKVMIFPAEQPPVAAAAQIWRPADQIADDANINRLLAHLQFHKNHYSRAILFAQAPADRSLALAALKLADGTTLADRVDNRPLEILGDYAAYPCTATDWATEIDRQLDESLDDLADERLVSMPSRGVFAEAKLGHCNASEVIDNTRFWDWQASPIPHQAPDIAPVTPVTPQPQAPNLSPTPFPQSLVNIVNPLSEPNPTGLASALAVLGTPNLFRDMSAQSQVADLLKRLSDNSIGIAQAAAAARAIQSNYSPAGLAGALTGSGGLNAGALVGGARAGPTDTSAATRDLGDFQSLLNRAVQGGLLTPAQAGPYFQKALDRGVENTGSAQPGDLQIGGLNPTSLDVIAADLTAVVRDVSMGLGSDMNAVLQPAPANGLTQLALSSVGGWNASLQIDSTGLKNTGLTYPVSMTHVAASMVMPAQVIDAMSWSALTANDPMVTGNAPLNLPLTSQFLLAIGQSTGSTHIWPNLNTLYPLEADVEAYGVAVFGYLLNAANGAVTPIDLTNVPKGRLKEFLANHGSLNPVDSATTAILAVFDLTLTSPKDDYQPKLRVLPMLPGPAYVARIYPLLSTWSSRPLASVSANLDIVRPAATMMDGMYNAGAISASVYTDMNNDLRSLWQDASPACQTLINAGSFLPGAGASPGDIALAFQVNTSTRWNSIFAHYRLDATTSFLAVSNNPARRTDMTARRAWDDGASAYAPTKVIKVERQGVFDNVHVAPAMIYQGAEASMAPLCHHDCLHMHWRWGEPFTDQPVTGWSGGKPYQKPGAPMIPENQILNVSVAGPRVTYSPTATAAPAGQWQVFMHHGMGYITDLTWLGEGMRGIEASTLAWPSWEGFYYHNRFYETGATRAADRTRLDETAFGPLEAL